MTTTIEAPDETQEIDASSCLLTSVSCNCPRCNSFIPAENARFKLLDPQIKTMQRVTMVCPHCQTAYLILRRLVCGEWVPAGKATILTDKKEIAAIKKEIDDFHSTIQLKKKR